MQTKGKFPQKIIKRGQYSNLYFNERGDFMYYDVDQYTKKEFIKEINPNIYPNKDLLQLLKSHSLSKSSALSTAEENNLIIFRDFLEKCLHLDANKRLNALEALTHEFIGFMPIKTY
jgi:serine/threonine-protein kinase PRP4